MRKKGGRAPAESHEERVISLGAELDASQQSEGRVLFHRLIELHHVQIFHRYPPEYRPVHRHSTHSPHQPLATTTGSPLVVGVEDTEDSTPKDGRR